MKRKFIQILSTVAAVLTVSACNLDINKDPYKVTTLDFAQVLTAAEYEVGITFSAGDYLNSNFSSYVHQTVSREVDNYSLVANYATLGNTWDQAYRYAIKNCDVLIQKGDAEGNVIYAGIARVLRAHIYMNLVDLWGDIPYSEANGDSETPKLDSSKDIYNALLADLNKALENFADEKAENKLKPGANDLFYGGNVEKWIKVTNTLKLKLLVQSRLAKSQINGWQKEVDALVAAGNFIGDGEDLQFPHSNTRTPMDERNGGYVAEYAGGQKSVYISPWFHECMTGATYNWKNNPFRGIVDPRIPYYFYNQIKASSDASNQTDYRDGAFVSIMFGSNSGYTSMTQEKSMTVVGIYPVGGKYDDGSAKAVNSDSGSASAPDKMLQAYSVPFMLAELALAGDITGVDAKAELENGIKASLTHVVNVSKACDEATPTIAASKVTEFINAVLGKYDAADATGKLEIVMTQKWIANFYNPVESYSDIRRTGYPVLFKGDADKMAWTPYAQTVESTQSLTSFSLVTLLSFPRIMYYPQSETTLNPNISNSGRIVSNKNVFWDVK